MRRTPLSHEALFSLNKDVFVFSEAKEKLKKTHNGVNKALPIEIKRDVSSILYNTDREHLIPILEAYGSDGRFDGHRQKILPMIFQREAFMRHGVYAPLVEELMETVHLKGDRSEANIEGWGRWARRKLISQLLGESNKFRHDNFKNIYQLNEIDLLNYDWSVLKELRCSAIQSDCGTNKTKGVIAKLVEWAIETDQSVLVVTPFVAVTKKMAEEIEGLRHYHSFGEKPAEKKQAMFGSRRLAICHKSLLYYKDNLPEFDIVIIDEASEVFTAWADPQLEMKEMGLLMKAMDNSKHTYIFDAHIDDELCAWGLSRIHNFQKEQAAIFINSASWGNGMEIHNWQCFHSIVQKMRDSLTEGKKICVFYDFSEENLRLSAFVEYVLEGRGFKTKAFDGDSVRARAPDLMSRPDSVISEWMKNGELDALFMTPWSSVGWDYLYRDEDGIFGDYVFDEVYLISRNGVFTPYEAWQSIRRPRLTKIAHTYLVDKGSRDFSYITQKTVDQIKGIPETREDEWAVRSHKTQERRKASVQMMWEHICETKGATLIQEASFFDEEQTEDLDKEFKVILDNKKNEFIKGLTEETEQFANAQKFCKRTDKGFSSLDIHTVVEMLENSRDEISTLSQRHKLFDDNRATLWINCWFMNDEQRRFLDKTEILSVYEIMGEFLEAINITFKDILPNNYSDIFDWYYRAHSDNVNRAILHGELNLINVEPLRNWVTREKINALKLRSSQFGYDALTEPQRLIRPLCSILDLDFRTKNELNSEVNPGKLTVPQIKKKLYESYKDNKQFPRTSKDGIKREWCKSNIRMKLDKEESLTKEEELFIHSLPKYFVICRKEYVQQSIVTCFETNYENSLIKNF